MELDERRAQLLDLGIQLFSDRGYDDVSIEDIAREAGVSKGLLYHYFGGKQDFHAACVGLGAERLIEAVLPNMSLPMELRPRAAVEAYLDFVKKHSLAFQVLMQGNAGGPEALQKVEATRERLVEITMEGIAPELRTPDRRLAARAWQGAVEQASLDWLAHDDVDKERVLEILLAALVGIWQVVPPPITQ
jgi:AcrR family transcriptional regulator